MWYKNIFDEIGMTLTKPIPIMVDNMSYIKMAKDPVFQGKTKHIEKSCHFIQDHVKKDRIILYHIRSKEQPANILTKHLPKNQFNEARTRFNLIRRQVFEELY